MSGSRRIWEERKKALTAELHGIASRSPVVHVSAVRESGLEWRAVVVLKTATIVKRDGEVTTAGPVTLGIRYTMDMIATAPSPFEVVTVFEPHGIFHPNVTSLGALCLGHPPAGFTVEQVLHSVWAGLNLNMSIVKTAYGDIANAEAAAYVRANSDRFPLTERGLYEAAEDDATPNHSLRSGESE